MRARWLFALLLAPGPLRPATAAAADVTILFWYDRGRPLESFKYQVYDLRKQEYTPAVARWQAATKTSHPGYAVYARDYDLSRVPGDTEKHRIGSLIVGEFVAVGTLYGYEFGPYPGVGLSNASRPPARLTPTPLQPLRGPATGPAYHNPGSAATPFPVPYPRPHP